ncbi:hypothetical protein B0A49_05212 [Cryomyces minteri]|uniref:F-box domain-containing protein n=1 Tax=Cryomyces minteri TaxID=331657 RepID=A0A4U0X019_9PEZI|nr:hypothetical protein B0A49_05212 [Cryomyces minteri]
MAVTRSQAAKRKHLGRNNVDTSLTHSAKATPCETTFLFLMLPAEIRHAIYLLALVNHGDIYVCSVDSFRAQVSQPAFTRVSRQVRRECLPVFYGCNRFRILAFSGEQYAWPHVWLKDIGSANCLMLRRLRVGAFELFRNQVMPSPNAVTRDLMLVGISLHRPLVPKQDCAGHWVYELDESDADAPFPFLELPAELRNNIYSLALVQPSRINVYDGSSSKQPPLTRVCKQIRGECLPLFYGANEFYAEVFAPRFKLPFWFRVIGNANCLLLRSLRVESFAYKPWPLVSVQNSGSGKACIWSYEFEKGAAPSPSRKPPAKLTP